MEFEHPQLYDAETGHPVDLPADKIGEALSTGRFAFMKGAQVPVIGPDGSPGFVPAEEAANAFSQGYKYDSPDLQADRAKEAEFGNRPIAAGLAGAARGLTFGLSDQALTKSGAVNPETLRELEERNKGASLAGEVTGAAAPLLLSGGTAGPAEAAAFSARGAARLAPSVLAARAGEAVAGGVGKALAEDGAQTLARKILTKTVAKSAGSAVEGALYGVGNVVSEDALGDPTLTAEKALSQIGFSALIGAGVGVPLGIISGVASKSATEGATKQALATRSATRPKPRPRTRLNRLPELRNPSRRSRSASGTLNFKARATSSRRSRSSGTR
jgi:hypothetical protein